MDVTIAYYAERSVLTIIPVSQFSKSHNLFMFSEPPKHIRHRVPRQKQVSQGEKKRASTFIEDKHGLLCSWLKTLYVGVTRARKRVTWRGVSVG